MRIGIWILYGITSVISIVFVIAILQTFANFENRKGLNIIQKTLLSCMIFLATYLVWSYSGHTFMNTYSMAIFLIIAVIDGLTGYVYNCCSYYVFLNFGITATCKHVMLSEYEMRLIIVYILLLFFCVAVKGLAEGDIPIYFALMFYYLTYADSPAYATIFMFLTSQVFFAIALLVNRAKQLPLIPYIWMSHLLTMCVWC